MIASNQPCLNCGQPAFGDREYCTRCRNGARKVHYTAETLLLYEPEKPSPFRPGSEDKIRTLAARYAAGIWLWNDLDCGVRDDG